MAEVIPGSFSRSANIGDIRPRYIPGTSFASQGFTPEGVRASMGLPPTGYIPGSSFASQGFTPEEGRASMGLAPTQQEKYNSSIEAMKQFNLGAFERAAPGTMFGQGDSGFQSPVMKARKIGFNNLSNLLFGGGM
tara:strand:- start:282 stop:686 length:405 start_codon:yes stop_codon:yes gene_type:complete